MQDTAMPRDVQLLRHFVATLVYRRRMANDPVPAEHFF
jgi:hypothetical protein